MAPTEHSAAGSAVAVRCGGDARAWGAHTRVTEERVLAEPVGAGLVARPWATLGLLAPRGTTLTHVTA